MKKKVNLLILLFVAVLCLSLAFVACNKIRDLTKAPDEIGVDSPDQSVIDKASQTDENLMLRFVFRKYMSSVFTAIPIEEFTQDNFAKLGEYINYQIIYASTGLPFEDKLYPLTMDMISEESKPYLSQSGRHTIKVALPLGDGKNSIEGSFTLNLAAETSNIEFVTVSFVLDNDSKAYFGTTKEESGKKIVSVVLQRGTTCTWDEFEKDFLIKKSGYVLDGITSGAKEYNTASTSIVFDADAQYNLRWKENTIRVTFHLNVPSDALFDTSSGRTQQDVLNEVRTQTVEMDKGTVARPDSNVINSYLGYYFAGWYYADPDEGGREKLWLFTQTVKRKDITLEGHWETRYYSFKIYTMGGHIKADAVSTVTDAEIAQNHYVYADCDVKFDLSTGDANEITFDKLTYNKLHADYVVRVKKSADSDETITIKLIEILTILEKGGDIFKTNGIYREATHTPESRFNPSGSTVVQKDEICYVEWLMEDAVKNDIDRFSDYYINYAFKGADGIVLKADGTLRINHLFDASMNELIIPDAIKWTDGVLRPISEVGDRALMNAKSLVKIDMSGASNLTTISDRAFCYCQNLTTVTFPTQNHITSVGEDAFSRTPWQNNYFDENESGMIVIGTALYKYTGDGLDEITVIDLNELNLSTTTVFNVSPGCFAEVDNLTTVMLIDNIDYIHNNAFNGLTALEQVVVSPTTQLTYIGENAFSGCTKFMSTDNTHNISDGAIVIGNVLYRLLDKDATTYNVKSNIEHIAPGAFANCTKLATVTFEDASKIKSSGKDAFIDTVWIQNDADGFTIINGVLAEVFSQDFKNRNVTIPDDVTIVSEYSFGSYARYIETIEFREGVEKIEDYAFAGASSVRSFIFTDTVLDGANGIVNIPSISGNSFANAKGVLLSGIKLYFAKEVYDYFATSACATTNPDWYEFFSLYSDVFAVETIEGIWINPAVVPSEFIKNTGSSALQDSYANGLVIKSSSGVLKYDVLDKAANTVAFLETEGEHYIVFSYKGSQDYCHINTTDEHVFWYNIRYAIKGEPAINSTLEGDGHTNADDYWIVGFDGDLDGVATPSFYTSHTTLDMSTIEFWYKDFSYDTTLTYEENVEAGHVHKIDNLDATNIRVSGYAPTVSKNATATFTVDFYGIGTYTVTIKYVGVKSKYIEINQKEAISIPLNGSASNYVRNSYVYLKGQDGREQKMLFNLNAFRLVMVDGVAQEELPTNKLGMHTMTVTYVSEDTDGTLEADIVYAVVLEADSSAFTFEIVNEQRHTAKIVACSNDKAETLVLPDKYTKNGIEYSVTEIGDGVFANFTALKTVYMPASLERIGTNAFAGCTHIEEIFTSTQTEYVVSRIPDENFDDLRVEQTMNGSVTVTELVYTIIPKTITIPKQFSWTETETIVAHEGEPNEYSYQRITTYVATPVFADKLFDKCKGTIWLFDSAYNRAYAEANLLDKTVQFYTDDDERTPAAQSHFKLDKAHFVATDKHVVKYAKLLSLENVLVSANGDMVITPSFDMPIIVTIKNIETGDLEDKVQGVDWEGALENYSAPDGYEIVLVTYERDYISATARELEVPDGFDGFVYLPDTIYNTTKIVDENGDEVEEALTIYKSGTSTLVSTLEHAPDTLSYIGTTAFKDCVNLKQIVFGEGTQLADICVMAFANCISLETIKYGKTAADWANVDKGANWNMNAGACNVVYGA